MSSSHDRSRFLRPGTWAFAGAFALALTFAGCTKSDETPRECRGDKSLCTPMSKLLDTGAVVFGGSCTGCHGLNGEGHAGSIPPVANSDWFMNNRRKSIEIVLAGYSDSLFVNGMWYFGGDMPGHQHFSDLEIAGVLTYLRSQLNDSTVLSCDPYDPEDPSTQDENGFPLCQKVARSQAARNTDSVAVWEVRAVRDSLGIAQPEP